MESITVLKTPEPRGFTLVEMIVVLAIIVMITGIALSGQTQFDRSLTVTDTAYTVALSVRQAQTYGLSSRTYGSTPNAGYGAHFSITTPTTYTLFADVISAVAPVASCPIRSGQSLPDDKPGDCAYQASGNEGFQNFTFGRGFKITNICGKDTANVLRCTSDGYLTGIDVVFIRPNTDSVVTGLRNAGNVQLNDAQITISPPDGSAVRTVCVTKVGEVSVTATTCP